MHHLNLLAISVTAIMTFVIGAPWYSPLKPRDSTKQKLSALVFGGAYLTSPVAALSYVLGPHPGPHRGVLFKAATGLLVVGGSFAVNYALGGKTLTLWLVDAGSHVVQFTGFGLVLGL